MTRQTIYHPQIGHVTGTSWSDAICQFRGIQYATLRDKFARGELVQYDKHDEDFELDATELGPTVLLPPGACEREQLLLGHRLPVPASYCSGTQCLTLHITTPAKTSAEPCPVMVFIHGGGFTTGSSNYPQYDLARITEMSVNLANPIVSVAVNYRVGPAGFLTCPVMSSAGYKPNNGLHDQKLALRWIQRYISGFGGDPNRVTVVGHSAGSSSIFYHLEHEEVLFHQGVGMAGSSLLRPRSAAQGPGQFASIAKALGLEGHDPAQQLNQMLRIPDDVFAERIGRRVELGPVVDGDIIPAATTYEILDDKRQTQELFPGLRGLRRFFIGDCQLDTKGMIWPYRLAGRKDNFSETLPREISRLVEPHVAGRIIEELQTPLVPKYGATAFAPGVVNLGNDLTFGFPANRFARAFASLGVSVYRYYFNAPNPFETPWKGTSTHGIDMVLLLLNYNHFLGPGQRKCAEQIARDVITFVSGQEPFKAMPLGAMVYDAPMTGDDNLSELVLGDLRPTRVGRREGVLVHEKGSVLDTVLDAWHNFMNNASIA